MFNLYVTERPAPPGAWMLVADSSFNDAIPFVSEVEGAARWKGLRGRMATGWGQWYFQGNRGKLVPMA